MPNRIILPLLLAASVVLARGSFADNEAKTLASKKAVDEAQVLGTTFNVVRPTGDGESLRFTLRIVNNTRKMVEIQFPDGQTHDFVVNDSTGKEVWRWSEGRMFTQAMRSKTLKGKDGTVFEEKWEPKGQRGAFTAVAILKSENFPLETSIQFALP